ncbi:hypothetical protein D3C76_1685860 [compost metagenome]
MIALYVIVEFLQQLYAFFNLVSNLLGDKKTHSIVIVTTQHVFKNMQIVILTT